MQFVINDFQINEANFTLKHMSDLKEKLLKLRVVAQTCEAGGKGILRLA